MNVARLAAVLALAAFGAAANGVDGAHRTAALGAGPAEGSRIDESPEAQAARDARLVELDQKSREKHRRNVRQIVIAGWSVAVVGCGGVALLSPQLLLVTCVAPLIYIHDFGTMEFGAQWGLAALLPVVVLAIWFAATSDRGLIERWIARRDRRLNELRFKRGVIVSFDDAGISAQLPRAEAETIAWSEVQRIAIERVDSGPAGAGLWWLLEGEGKRCAFPRSARGERDVRAMLAARFPGFSREAVAKAEGCKANARYLCWERAVPPSNQPPRRPHAGAPLRPADAVLERLH